MSKFEQFLVEAEEIKLLEEKVDQLLEAVVVLANDPVLAKEIGISQEPNVKEIVGFFLKHRKRQGEVDERELQPFLNFIGKYKITVKGLTANALENARLLTNMKSGSGGDAWGLNPKKAI